MARRTSDVELVLAECQSGDWTRVAELRRWLSEFCFYAAHRWTDDIEDLVQDALVQVLCSIRTFRGDSQFTTWLHRVALNVVLMHRRAMKYRPQLPPCPVRDLRPDRYSLPDDRAACLEQLRALMRLVDSLSEERQRTFTLHELEGVYAEEIAERERIPLATVRTRLFYSRRKLAEKMRSDPVLADKADMFARPRGRDHDARAYA